MVSLDLTLLYLKERWTADVQCLAEEMVAAFESQEVHREAWPPSCFIGSSLSNAAVSAYSWMIDSILAQALPLLNRPFRLPDSGAVFDDEIIEMDSRKPSCCRSFPS